MVGTVLSLLTEKRKKLQKLVVIKQNYVKLKDIEYHKILAKGSFRLQFQPSKTYLCQTKLQTPLPHFQPSLTTGNHVIWLQSEASHSLFLPTSLFRLLCLSQSSTVEQNVRLRSGKRQ